MCSRRILSLIACRYFLFTIVFAIITSMHAAPVNSAPYLKQAIFTDSGSNHSQNMGILEGKVFLIAAKRKTASRMLRASELRGILAKGQTFRWRKRKTVGTVIYYPNGSTVITWKSPSSKGRSSGRWRVSGNKLCRGWKKIRGGREECGHVYRRADGFYVTREPSGGYRAVARPAR